MKIAYPYIAIEGVIGAGKTTLAKMLAKELNAKLLLESFEENAFLPPFYKDPERYAFPVEMSFLADRYNQLKVSGMSHDLFHPLTIADYFIDKSLIFANINLKNDELKLYKRLFYIMRNTLPQPHLILYLHQNIDRVLKNIEKRGRNFERDIPAAYLRSLHAGYMQHFISIQDATILIVNVENIDFVKNKKDFILLLNLLKKQYKKGIVHINPEKKSHF